MLALLLLLPCFVFPSSSDLRIQLSTGQIEGKVLNATYSPFGIQTANGFFGIPYATPPLGELRFRKPRPPATWQGILETKQYKPACLSDKKRTYKNDEGGPISEDCLYLNVFTNDYCMKNKSCSVMLVAHGGVFLFESASAFNPEIFVNNFVGQDRNIVVVTFNYRLGFFGFGQFNGDDNTSFDHNVGLSDMLEAVKWVRKEIGHFGGNKDRITIAGHSAGAALCFLFSVSPLSKGLIHQQIIMSGPMPNFSKSSNLKASTAIAQRLGCIPNELEFNEVPKPEMEQTLSCLRNLTGEVILEAQLDVIQNSTHYFTAPPVDGEFVIDYPDRVLARNGVHPINTMLGTLTAEWRDSQTYSPSSRKLNDAYTQAAPTETGALQTLCEHIGFEIYSESEEFVENCRKFYGNGKDVEFLSDDMEFYSGAMNIANAHTTKNTKVYLYSYGYSGAGGAYEKYSTTATSPQHSEDLIYVFGTHRGVMTPKDYVIEKIYSGMFANFVNNEDPSPSESQKWKQYTPENREYFEIDFDSNLTMPGTKSHYYPRAFEFWMNPKLKKQYSERFAPSLDSFLTTNLVAPIVSHLSEVSRDMDKPFEFTEKLYNERVVFLDTLKEENVVQKRESVSERARYTPDDGVLLWMVGGVALFQIVGILIIGIWNYWHPPPHEGYQLVKRYTV